MLFPLRDDNPTTSRPALTVTLIAANVVIFFYQFTLPVEAGRTFIYQFGTIPAVVLGSRSLPAALAAIPAPLSLLTGMFLHGGLMHLGGNMLYLWIFGNNIEDAMGRGRFLLFYVLCGIGAAAAQILGDPHSTVPMVGASGAISGVLGAYLLLFPRAQVLVLVFFFFIRLMYIPAAIVLGMWFVIQVASGAAASGAGSGVAWWAHVGGFVVGMMLVGLFKRPGTPFFHPPVRHESRFENWR
jgi:membrane associated rhomboid family serine protease